MCRSPPRWWPLRDRSGSTPPRDRARFVSEFARLLYTPASGKSAAVAALLNPKLIDPAEVAAAGTMRVPVPLSAEVWSRAIFKRTIRRRSARRGDHDRSTRGAPLPTVLPRSTTRRSPFSRRHPTLLTRLYEEAAPAFAAFGASLRIRANQVVTPGGPAAVPLWEGIVRRAGRRSRALRARAVSACTTGASRTSTTRWRSSTPRGRRSRSARG